jgi:hypothetical protein
MGEDKAELLIIIEGFQTGEVLLACDLQFG